MIRVLLVDDEWAVRRGLRMQLELEPDVVVVGEAEDGHAALQAVPALDADVVLMDVRMPGMDGLAAVAEMTRRSPRTAVVMLSLHDDPATRALAAAAGARAFVGKHEAARLLLPTIRLVAGGS